MDLLPLVVPVHALHALVLFLCLDGQGCDWPCFQPPQADWLAGMLETIQTPIDVVVLLTAPDEVLLDRMLARGRDDDTVEAIKRRLDIYHRETKPLTDYYGGRVVHVDGVGAVDEVHERVLKAVRDRKNG